MDHNLITSFSGIQGPQNLKHLSLANNNLNNIGENAFLTLESLEHLDIHGNRLKETVSFENLPHLQVLLLSHNQLTAIPNHLSSKLKTLDLGDNQIEHIPEGSFNDLDDLFALRLAGNNIAKLNNASFGNIPSLQLLNLASNHLEAIPQATFVGLQKLRGLRLDDNALTDLNGIVASLGHLQWLNVSANQLGMISHKISLITIFGHKHFRQKFHQKFDIFHKKFQQPLILVHICYEIANFEAKILQK